MRFSKINPALLALPFALTLASAQQGGGGTGTGQRQMTPEMRARMAQMRPIIDLSQTVRLLPELEKNKTTAVTKAQAKSLLTILTALQKASAVQPNDAKKYLAQIEDKILTDKQLTAMDTLMLNAEKERAAQRAKRQQGGQTGRARIPGIPGGLLPGQGGQRQGGQNGQGQNGQGQPGQFNPFKGGRGSDELKAYISVLQKK
ncbi:hypothetical protein [Deinococcus hopiensis]|uniref:LTXXQ motif family protein n=1 Tax=Deinococcus hopiensis KR-140 TaxID=695939 RepID=A0A1W1UEG2_9DEIO|nr:hypothetical protein [Deinococcus hopiensis]SMB79191.1 hypothetical protein SAMN00790413_05825 [Deinococcus hopiensis KR-140]